MFLRRGNLKLKLSYLSFLVCLYTANIGVLFNRKNFSGDKMNELPLFNERNTAYSSTWIRYASIKSPLICNSFNTSGKNTTHYQWSHHAWRAFQPDSHHNDRCQNQCHQSHARYGISAHDSDCIGGYRCEQEWNSGHQQDSYQCMHQVALHHIEIEEKALPESAW